MMAERISLWALGAMVSLPFLVPFHLPPISSFYAEWLAAVLGLAAVPVLLARGSRPLWPACGYLPLLLLGVLLAQTLSGLLPYAETGLLGMLYLIWAALLMTVAATLKQRLGAEAVADTLAVWLLGGALVGALVGILGHLGIHSAWIVPPNNPHTLYGNLAQPNQFADQLWLGIASALYLAGRGRLPVPALTLALALLLPAAALSGSRSSLLYALWLAAVGSYWQGFGGGRRCLAVAGAYVALALLLPWLLAWGEQAPVARLGAEAAAAGGLRPTLALIGWRMFLQSPWLGTGFGSFGRASFEHAAEDPAWIGRGEHAHNLVAQLLGELGIFATAGTVVLLVLWGRRLAGDRRSPVHAWLAGVGGCLLIHSLVEYPLWYAYFLGIFAVALGLGETRTAALRLRPAALAAPAVLGVAVGLLLLRDFRGIVALEGPLLVRHGDFVAAIDDRSQALLAWRSQSLLKPYVDTVFLSLALPEPEGAQARARICDINIGFQPTAPAVFNCAAHYLLAGETATARRLWAVAGHAYPEAARDYTARLPAAVDDATLRRLRPLLAPALP